MSKSTLPSDRAYKILSTHSNKAVQFYFSPTYGRPPWLAATFNQALSSLKRALDTDEFDPALKAEWKPHKRTIQEAIDIISTIAFEDAILE